MQALHMMLKEESVGGDGVLLLLQFIISSCLS